MSGQKRATAEQVNPAAQAAHTPEEGHGYRYGVRWEAEMEASREEQERVAGASTQPHMASRDARRRNQVESRAHG